MGKVIYQTNLTRTTFLWETGTVENGIYLITLKSSDTLFGTKKVVVQR